MWTYSVEQWGKLKKMLQFAMFLILLLPSWTAIAQNAAQDSTAVTEKKQRKQKKDTVNRDFRPVSLRFGTDLIGLTKTFVDKDKSEFEISADMVFYKYLFNVEFGYLQVNRIGVFDPTGTDSGLLEGESYDYQSEGSYLRFGPDINLLKNDPDRSVLLFGLRYGLSRFKDDIVFEMQEDVWPNAAMVRGEAQNDEVRASWLEATTGLKVKVWKDVWLGYTARFKFGLSVKGADNLEPFDVPGYGRAAENTYWGFNYYLFYTLPLRRDKGR